jgi:hypothetical protein
MGDNFADVDAGTGGTFLGSVPENYVSDPYLIVGFEGFPLPEGLVPGTTYYWRVDEINDLHPDSPWKGNVWSFTVPPKQAYGPTPADGAKFIDTNVNLTWTPGFGATLHTVYFGDDFDTVNNATGGAGLPFTTYTPGPLELDKTYYWRVDETDDVLAVHRGDVWSFRTMPIILITDPNLVGWWKFDEGQGSVALDWSGHGNHGPLVGDPQWVAGYDGGALDFDGSDDYVEVPQLVQDDFTIAFWVKTTQTGGTGPWYQSVGLVDAEMPGVTTDFGVVLSGSNAGFGLGAVDTTITSTTNINDGTWHHVAATRVSSSGLMSVYVDGSLENSGTGPAETRTAPSRITIGMIQTSFNYFSGQIDDVRIYTRTLTQQEVKETMRVDPLLAWNPKPANGSTPDIHQAMPLSWSPGDKASQHEVYLGTDEDAVDNADTSTPDIYRGRQSATSYTPPEGVEWGGGPYYWRIDEYNTDATINKGRVWSFRVADFILVDDIEDYDINNPIWENWIDGLGYVTTQGFTHPGNGTGAEIGDPSTGSYTEETIFHSGGQSMPFWYNNNKPDKWKYSEAKLTLSHTRNWTEENVKALSLWFYGDPANAAEQMYLAVANNTGAPAVVEYAGDADDLKKAGWQEWNIDLREFTGISLTDVNSIAIGFGDRNSPQIGGSGKMYFDDIRLYRARCVPSILKPDADLSGNCVVDMADIEMIAADWLATDSSIAATAPSSPPVGWWKFDNNTNDSAGNNHGIANGFPSYATGMDGRAISLDGVDDYVSVAGVGISGAAPRTIAGWAKANATEMNDWTNVFGFTGPAENGRHFDIQYVGDTDSSTHGYYGVHMYGDEYDIMPVDLDWHHLAATYDGTATYYYGDGILIGSGTYAIDTPGTIHMGKREDNTNFFPGSVDDVRIYNYVLSDAEVAGLVDDTPGDGQLYIPVPSAANIYDDEPEGSRSVDFKDFAILADSWLDELLWPQP